MDVERKRFLYSLLIVLLFILVLVLVRVVEDTLDLELYTLGILPRRLRGLLGIVTAPLVHSGWEHLANNALSLLILGTGLFYFYRDLAVKVFFYSWFFTGLAVWLGARTSYHIGASGLIYGMASFLFFSGIIRKHISLMAISLAVVFLYGSMVWGILPLREGISWESHLLGAGAGWILAILYRKQGPQRPFYEWELEEEEEEFDEAYWDQVLDDQIEKKKKKKKRKSFWEDFFGDPFSP